MASGWSFGSAAKPDLWGVPTVEMGGRGTLHDTPATSGGWGGFSGTTEIKEVPATATTPAGPPRFVQVPAAHAPRPPSRRQDVL